VLDAVLPLPWAVVEADKAFAVAGRPTDVRIEDGDAELIDQIVVAAEETRTRLPLGPPMDVHDQRTLAGEAAGVRTIEETGNGFAVEAPGLDQLRLHVCGRVEAAGFARRPAGQLERRRIK